MEVIDKKAGELEILLKRDAGLECRVSIGKDRESLLITYENLSMKQLNFINKLNGQFEGIFIYYICRDCDNNVNEKKFLGTYDDGFSDIY